MKALIIVDVQNDFLPARDGQDDGALAVQDGSDVIPVIKSLLDGAWNWDVVVASQVLSRCRSGSDNRIITHRNTFLSHHDMTRNHSPSWK